MIDLPILYYVHDPMCSWCWGFRDVWQELQQKLSKQVEIKTVLGGLAPDSDMPMPQAMQDTISNTWKKIELEIPGTKFNHEFWTKCQPRRSTYPSCRAMIACRMQSPDLEPMMLYAIQQAYYLKAQNPSDISVLIDLAKNIGLDSNIFSKDIMSESCQLLFENELALSRRLYVSSFPSLVLSYQKNESTIKVEYNDSNAIYNKIVSRI